MAESNLHALDINLIAAISDENEEGSSIQVSEMFSLSPWYSDIIYVLKNLSPPPDMTRNQARTANLKAAKFCILNSALYWKDVGGVLLNCLVEKEAKKVMEDCHQGDCGGHPFWRSIANKILRVGYYWLTLFADVYKKVKHCHKCQIFEGKKKLQPLPLKPIEGIAWEDVISSDLFGTSQRGSRHSFVAVNQVLSPSGVEGASLQASKTQVQDKGKRPMHDKGPSSEQEADFILIQDDDADVESAKLGMII
eukprot:PITA_31575